RHRRLVSDWSSDVCSSDLFAPRLTAEVTKPARRLWPPKVDGSKPRRAAPCLTMAATFRGARRRSVMRCEHLLKMRRKMAPSAIRSEEHTSELQSLTNIVCR